MKLQIYEIARRLLVGMFFVDFYCHKKSGPPNSPAATSMSFV